MITCIGKSSSKVYARAESRSAQSLPPSPIPSQPSSLRASAQAWRCLIGLTGLAPKFRPPVSSLTHGPHWSGASVSV